SKSSAMAHHSLAEDALPSLRRHHQVQVAVGPYREMPDLLLVPDARGGEAFPHERPPRADLEQPGAATESLGVGRPGGGHLNVDRHSIFADAFDDGARDSRDLLRRIARSDDRLEMDRLHGSSLGIRERELDVLVGG